MKIKSLYTKDMNSAIGHLKHLRWKIWLSRNIDWYFFTSFSLKIKTFDLMHVYKFIAKQAPFLCDSLPHFKLILSVTGFHFISGSKGPNNSFVLRCKCLKRSRRKSVQSQYKVRDKFWEQRNPLLCKRDFRSHKIRGTSTISSENINLKEILATKFGWSDYKI